MKKLGICFLSLSLFAIAETAEATSAQQACALLNQIQNEMNVVASNIVNVNTTRTPEGGPYLQKEFICQAEKCSVEQISKTKIVYEPSHPDAEPDGYVSYPDIDVDAQAAKMASLIRDYENSAKICFGRM